MTHDIKSFIFLPCTGFNIAERRVFLWLKKLVVAEQKEHNPDLFLEAAIPYAGRLKTKNKQFHELLRACDGIKIVCQEYAPSCFLERNRYMAGESQRVIAVYDGRERGGTLFTMRYAHSIGREVREIRV